MVGMRNFAVNGFPSRGVMVRRSPWIFDVIDLLKLHFIGSAIIHLYGEAGLRGNRFEQGAAAAGRIEVEIKIVDMGELAGLIGNGRLVAKAFPDLQNLLAGAGIDHLNAKRQAAPIQAHHRNAALLEVEVFVDDEGRVLLDDNGVTLQDNFIALRSGLVDDVAEDGCGQEGQA